MLQVLVLGSGCSKCQATTDMIGRVARDLGVAVEIGKITDHNQIQGLGVNHTPAVLVDGKLVHSGGIPSHQAIALWLSPKPLGLLNNPSRHMFFTGKGGVGKTSLSTVHIPRDRGHDSTLMAGSIPHDRGQRSALMADTIPR